MTLRERLLSELLLTLQLIPSLSLDLDMAYTNFKFYGTELFFGEFVDRRADLRAANERLEFINRMLDEDDE